MQVYCDEGETIHISPEPCIAIREGRGEASVGKTCKPAVVPRKWTSDRSADDEGLSEGNMQPCVKASAAAAPRGLRHWRAWKSLVREPGEIMTGQRKLVRVGKAYAEADDARS